jgi:drug/metabolite transporter (DMT)-like permease
VLGPEQREDRQLEVVRVAPEQLADTVELPVREAERAVERFRNLAQGVIVSGKPDVVGAVTVKEMSRRYGPLILVLAAIWGASYLFIKVGVRDFEPTVLMALRLVLAGLILLGFLAAKYGVRESLAAVGGAWRVGFVVGTINGALPFTLIAWGETHIDSGVAAIANASVPIFVALLAIRFNPGERSGGLRLVGILVGLVGVGVLAGVHPEGGGWAVLGTLAVVLASLSYAAGGLYGQRALGRATGPVLATASMLYGGVLLVPFALVQLPNHAPGWKPVLSLLGLAILGTAVAQLILFRMLRLFGAARLSLVTYLLPVFALLYGSLILDEPLRPSMLVGLGLILAGVTLGSGAWRPLRRPVADSAA